ncbi:unnamed protein product, partial [Coregonus sp. 'balchen']
GGEQGSPSSCSGARGWLGRGGVSGGGGGGGGTILPARPLPSTTFLTVVGLCGRCFLCPSEERMEERASHLHGRLVAILVPERAKEESGCPGLRPSWHWHHSWIRLMGYNEKPVNLQMFIGTADDRYLRPHAFYQMHRITGKTVATASQEIIISSTKVLEIPLLPENNMSASIDCAGILKLRNSDIELRKGETDIGRKNTRVRVVFRVHIPQTNGKVLSLQAASIPVECSQRSAQELPQVEKASLTSSLVSGGEEIVITGSNFFPESKMEDHSGKWRRKSSGRKSNIVVEVPPYHSKTVTSAVQVQFYVCNGKRKRSQSQRFTYLLVRNTHTQLPSPEQGHPPDGLLSSSPRGLAAGPGPSLHTLQPACPLMGSPSFQHLPHLQGRGLHMPADCHMTFHPGPAPPNRPSYQHHPMQQSHSHPGHVSNLNHNLPYNGQSSLPMNMNTGAPQGYERMPYHQQQSDPGASHPMGLGMVYHSSPSTSAQQASSPHSPIPTAPHSQPMTHSSHSAPHLLSMGYHCSPNPSQVPSPTHPNHPMGQPSPTHPNHPMQPSPQLQRAMGGYHPTSQRSASCPTTSSAPPAHIVPSPHSGPSSPQLHSLPYQSPTSPSPTGSPLGHPAHSPQASSPVMSSLSPGGPGPLVQQHPLAPQQGPFPTEGESMNIKQEPEESEPTFRSIGLQDITLDDGCTTTRRKSQNPGTMVLVSFGQAGLSL